MAYIGNTVQNQGFSPAIDYFSGNGSTVTFTLSRPIASVAQIICAIDNVIQNPSSAYTVSGNAITFTSAPLSGTNNIWVEYTSLITTYAALSQSPSVVGDITASGGYLAVGNFGASFVDGTIVDYVTGNGRITTGPADGLTIYNGGTSARSALMTLDSSGNMGVGTTSPVANSNQKSVTVNGTSYSRVDFQVGGSSTAYLYSGASNTNLGTTGSTFIAFDTNATERMRIDASGNLLVGTTVIPTGATKSILLSGTGYIDWGQGDCRIADSSGAMLFSTYTTGNFGERMRITGDGWLLVGTTSKSATVNGTNIRPNGCVTVANNGSDDAFDYYNTTGGNFRFYVAQTGTISSTNGTINVISDQRLKENIRDLEDGLDKVLALKPRKFDWKAGKGSDTKDVRGFIAQEFETVFPDLIGTWKDPAPEGEEPYKSVNADLVPTLVKAIQEQQDIIKALTARIEALESK